MSQTRTVNRVHCWHHNVVILETYQPCTEGERWAFQHGVVMWTPQTPLQELSLMEEEGHVLNLER